MVRLIFDKKLKGWREIEEGEISEITLDGFLKKKLDNVKKLQSKGWDCLIIIDGARRGGKSTLAMIIAKYLYYNLSINNFIVGLEDAPRKIDEAKDQSVLIMDEGSLTLSSKDVMNKEQKKLIKIIDVIGQKGLALIVVLPSFFDLARPIAISHSRFLLHIYTDKKLNRGRFAYFGTKRKRILYEIGKKNFNSYSKPKANFRSRFSKYEPDFYKDYLKLKRKSMREAVGEKSKEMSREQKREITKEYLKNVPKLKRKLSKVQLGVLFDCSDETIRNYLLEMSLKLPKPNT